MAGPSVILKGGVLTTDQRTTNIHPEAWDPKSHTYSPFNMWPLTTMLDGVASGEIKSMVYHWFEKPFNALIGTITDVYTTNSLGTAVTGATASGTEVFLKPDASGFEKLRNVKVDDVLDIYSSSVYGRVKGRVSSTAIVTSSNSYIGLILLETDTLEVLAGTGLNWTIVGRGEAELRELSDSISEHETEYYNYIGEMDESHSISERELYEESRLEQDIKKEKELESLHRLNQRREFALLEGPRNKNGSIYTAGGLRYFLNTYESSNVINWRTDTTYSTSTDTVLGGSLDFLKRVSMQTRLWSPIGTRKRLLMSQYSRDVIDRAVRQAGMYNISYETDNYGINIAVLRGLDQEMEIVEEPLFNTNTAFKNTIYMVEPKNIKRKTFAKGELTKIPWSNLTDDGKNRTTYIKGGWRVKETYQFLRLASHAIIDNFGVEKP
jgi:hypothetical protein